MNRSDFFSFQTPSDENSEAFILVGRQTTIPSDALFLLAETSARRIREQPGKSTSATARDLCQIDWEWPEFNTMLKMLYEDDLWPSPWHRYEKKVKAGADLRDCRAKIFIATVRTAATSIRAQRKPYFISELREAGWHLYTDSEVSAHYLDRFGHGGAGGSDISWPPLYPGDQSRIAKGMAGIYTRAGKFFGLGKDKPFWA